MTLFVIILPRQLGHFASTRPSALPSAMACDGSVILAKHSEHVLCPDDDLHISDLRSIGTISKTVSYKTPTAWNEDRSIVCHIHANRTLKSRVFIQYALFLDTIHYIGCQFFGKLSHIFRSDICRTRSLAEVFDQMWMTTIRYNWSALRVLYCDSGSMKSVQKFKFIVR